VASASKRKTYAGSNRLFADGVTVLPQPGADLSGRIDKNDPLEQQAQPLCLSSQTPPA
jgi:hypothetical protein